MLKNIVVPLFFLGALAFAAECPFIRTEERPDLTPGTRQRIAEQPALYPEVQYKYGLFQNFLGMYIDRPLFYDRSLRPKTFAYITPESYFRDIAIMKTYGFDGSGSLALGILKLYKQVNAFLDSTPDRAHGHREYPQFAFGEMGRFSADDAAYQQAREILAIALKSPFAPRIAGRIPISTYNSGFIPDEAMRPFLAGLRQEFGDTFAVCGGLKIDHDDRLAFNRQGDWPADVRAKYRQRIADILALFDGIQIALPQEKHGLDYMTEPDFALFDRCLQPMLLEQLAQPKNSRKLLACSLVQGYINHFTGVSHGEFGTARLRGQLDRLITLNPDLVFCFEWNEFNENTCFQPTLTNSLALQRIMRFYTNRLKQLPPEANPGDDPSIPPLILSFRESLKMGEPLQFELLNVPDTTTSQTYTARLELRDASGKPLASLPAETFDRRELKAVTFTLPTEHFSRETILQPHLTVTNDDGSERPFSQLQYVQLLPTWCRHYKSIRHPLRDLLQPAEAAFSATPGPDGTFTLAGRITTSEPLASLEVTDCGREFYAVDPADEFNREKNHIVVATLSTRQGKQARLTLRVSDAPGWRFAPWQQANISFGDWTQQGDTMTSRTLLWAARVTMILAIPKNAGPDAEISLALDNERLSFRLKQLLDGSRLAHVYPQARADWQLWHALPDIPLHLNQNEAAFQVSLPSQNRYPLFQMRAVTRSGKIYRSVAVMPQPVPAATEPLRVFSETSGTVLTVPVLSALVPDIRYTLDPDRGACLTNGYAADFDAQLGGGFVYDQPFTNRTPLPDERHVPRFVVSDAGPALHFDTSSCYVNLPEEAFPRGPFTLQFEINPEAQEIPYILFRHYSWIVGSLTLFSSQDRLHLLFVDKNLQAHRFNTELQLPPGSWSRVSISYDYQQFTCAVNDRQETFATPAPLRALYRKPAVFGGHAKPEFGSPAPAAFFRGQLRQLHIRHNAP